MDFNIAFFVASSRFMRVTKPREIVGRYRALLRALQSCFAVHERRGRKLHRQQEENRQGHLISNHVHYCTLAQLSSRPLFTSYFWLAMFFAASSGANADSTLRLVRASRANWHVCHNCKILFALNYSSLKYIVYICLYFSDVFLDNLTRKLTLLLS